MAWRDWLRRRAAGPERGGSSGPGSSAPGTAGTSAPGTAGSSVPGDWDGGWRGTTPPPLTVSRAPLGVSDGLAFRAGLAAWQNPSFGTGLGHALLSTAPTGLVRDVTHPATPRPSSADGGPLLLRALRPQGVDGPEGSAQDDGAVVGAGRSDGAAPAGAGAERGKARTGADRSGAARERPGGAPRPRDVSAAGPPAVLPPSPGVVQRAVAPDAAPVVAPTDTGRPPAAPPTPLVRRVRVVAAPGTAAEEATGRSAAPGGRAPDPPSGAGGAVPDAVVRRAGTGPTRPRPARGDGRPQASANSAPSAPSAYDVSTTEAAGGPRPAVRLRPVGPVLTVARRPAAPVRRVPALRPATTSAPGAGTASDAPGPTAPAGPVQRAASRSPLGAPTAELPPTASPSAGGAPAAPGPALPVVQRRTENAADTPGAPGGGVPATGSGTSPESPAPGRTSGPAPSGARARGGLGAPLPALPPSADVHGPAASGARAPRTEAGADIQRAPARSAPGLDRTSTPKPPAHEESRANAPVLGTTDIQRHLTPPARDTTPPGAPHHHDHGDGPATPLVTPTPPAAAPHGPDPLPRDAAEAAVRPPEASGGGAGAVGRPFPEHAVPGPVVVARAVTGPGAGAVRTPAGDSEDTSGARPPGKGTGEPRPLTVARSVTPFVPAVTRTLALLPGRPLVPDTRVRGEAAPAAASRPGGGRPVVAARWTAPPPTSAGGPPAPRVQRATGAPGPRNTAVRGTRAPDVVQRVPVVRPVPPPEAPGTTTAPAASVPARSLPVTASWAPPLKDGPTPPASPSASTPAPADPVPVVRPRPAAGGTPVQRDASLAEDLAVPKGVTVKAGPQPARGRPRSASAPPAPAASASTSSAAGKDAAARHTGTAPPPQDPGLDLDDLARRLIDPVARLLRTELRRGRERVGRPHDGRR